MLRARIRRKRGGYEEASPQPRCRDLLASSTRAEVLLTINVYDPAAVVFTATEGLASSTVTGYSLNLPTFFFGYPDGLRVVSAQTSTLQATGGGTAGLLGDFSWAGSSQDFAISPFSEPSPPGTLVFTAGQRALQGRVTVDLSSIADILPTTEFPPGSLQAYTGNAIVDIGEYRIISEPAPVPEPHEYALAVSALLAIAIIARRRRAALR